ncbi:MAG: CinA family protein [Bifidobacteriaceae bacterium]|nr:CinA family protein [Bifidobacteriaceae bacterium]
MRVTAEDGVRRTYRLAANIMDSCRRCGWHLACAESLTGGLLANAFVSVPGASSVFLGSAVTYDEREKAQLLGVDDDILKREGAVNPDVARQMADGAARLYGAALNGAPVAAMATTGVAGPDSDGFKPVGLVYIAISTPDAPTRVQRHRFNGDRAAIRYASVTAAVELMYSTFFAGGRNE